MLPELLADGIFEVGGPDAPAATGQLALDRQLLGTTDDVFHHGTRCEVLERKDLLVAVLVGDLEEAVALVVPVHALYGGLDHAEDRLVAVSAAQRLDQFLVDREVACQVAAEDV